MLSMVQTFENVGPSLRCGRRKWSSPKKVISKLILQWPVVPHFYRNLMCKGQQKGSNKRLGTQTYLSTSVFLITIV